MNSLTIIGNLTRDPDTRTTSNGKIVCNFTVAVSRNRKSSESQTDFFRCAAWNKLGESCQQYLSKGRKVAVQGTVYMNEFENKRDGSKQNSLCIDAAHVEFLSSKADAEREQEQAQYGYEPPVAYDTDGNPLF